MQPGQAAQPSPLAQTFTAWFRGPGLTSTALSLAIVLGSAAISAILTLVAMSTMDSTKMFPTTFSTLPLLMGWSLGGQFVMSGSNSYETVTLTFTLLPMGALTAAGIGVFWLARRRAAVDGSAAPLVPTLARAGAEALAVALVACLVTAPFSMTATMMGLKVMTVSSSALMTILLVTVVVFVALVVARSGGSLLERLPSPVVQVSRELGALSTALGVVLGIFIIVAYIAAVLIQGSGFASILLLPVLLPNLVLLALGMGSLGGITLDKSEAAAALAYFLPSLGGKDGGDAYAWTWFGSWSILLFAAMIVAIVAAALRVGVRRARTGRTEWQRVWQLPLVALALGAIVFYGLLPLRFSGADTPMRSSGGGSGHYMSVSLQPNALTFLLVGVVAAIISVLAEMLPPVGLLLLPGSAAAGRWEEGQCGLACGHLRRGSDVVGPAVGVQHRPGHRGQHRHGPDHRCRFLHGPGDRPVGGDHAGLTGPGSRLRRCGCRRACFGPAVRARPDECGLAQEGHSGTVCLRSRGGTGGGRRRRAQRRQRHAWP